MAGGTINLAVKTTNDNSGLKAAGADLDNFGKSAATAGGQMDAFDKKQAQAAKNLSDGLVKASALASVGILAIGGMAIKTAADFERSMDQVGAVAGATASEMQQLNQAAKSIGADTAFSASQAAGAMEELAAGGRSVAQILNGEARAAVDLAAAGNYGLAESGRTIATVMDVWKNSTIETNDVVNRLAGAANASRFGVDDMSQAIAQAGGVAASMGVEFDDFTAAIASTASSFASGSDAGTSYKTFLLGLDGSTDKAKSKIEELGLAFRDSNGQLKSTAEIAQELADKVGILGEAEQVAALKTIFGNDAYRTAVGLMNQTAEGVNKVNEVLGNTDASVIAEQRMSNLAGSFEAFKGSAETLAISLGEKALPALTNMADAGVVALNAFGSLPESTQGMALGFTAIAVAAPAATALIGKMAENAKALKTVMTGGASIGTLGPAFSAAAIGIGALALGVDALLQKTKGYGLAELVFGNPRAASAGNAFNKELQHTLEIARGAGVEINTLTTAWDQYAEGIEGASEKSQSAADKRTGLTEALGQAYLTEEASVWDLKRAYDAIGTTMEAQGLLAEGAQATFDNQTGVLEKYALAVQNMNVEMSNAFYAIEDANAGVVLSTGAVAEAIPPATSALDEFVAGLEEGKTLAEELGGQLDILAGRFGSLDPQMAINNINLAILQEELADVTRAGGDFSERLGMTVDQMKDSIAAIEDNSAALSENEQAYRDVMGGVEALSGAAGVLSGSVLNIDEAIQGANLSAEAQIEVAGQVGQAFSTLASDNVPAFISALLTIGETSPEVMKTVVDSITDPGQKAAILDHLRGMGSEADTILTEGFGEASNSAVAALNEGLAAGIPTVEGTAGQMGFAAVGAVDAYSDDMYSSGFTLGTQAGAGLLAGLASYRDSVVAAAQNIASSVASAMAGPAGLDTRSPSKKTRKIGQYAAEGLAKGMDDRRPLVRASGEAMAAAAVDGARQEMAAATDGYGILITGQDRHGRSATAESGNPMGWVQSSNGIWKWVEIKDEMPDDTVYGGSDINTPPVTNVVHPPPPPPKPRETTTPTGPADRPIVTGPGGSMQPGDTTKSADGRVYWDGTGEEPSEPWIGTGALLGQTGEGKKGLLPLIPVGNNVAWDPNKGEYVTTGLQPVESGSNVGWDLTGGTGFGIIDPVKANYGLSVYQDSNGVWRDVVTNEEAIGADGRFKNSRYQQDAVAWQSRLKHNATDFAGRGLQAAAPAKQSEMGEFLKKLGMNRDNLGDRAGAMNDFEWFTTKEDWASIGFGDDDMIWDPWFGFVPKSFLKSADGQAYLAMRGIDPENNSATRNDYNPWHPNATTGGRGTRVSNGDGTFRTVQRRQASGGEKQVVVNVMAADAQSFLRMAPMIREALRLDEGRMVG